LAQLLKPPNFNSVFSFADFFNSFRSFHFGSDAK